MSKEIFTIELWVRRITGERTKHVFDTVASTLPCALRAAGEVVELLESNGNVVYGVEVTPGTVEE